MIMIIRLIRMRLTTKEIVGKRKHSAIRQWTGSFRSVPASLDNPALKKEITHTIE